MDVTVIDHSLWLTDLTDIKEIKAVFLTLLAL